MKTPLTINIRAVQRVACVMLAALLVAAVLPLIHPSQVGATQLSSRSIQISDSGASGGAIVSGLGSGTSVDYQVTFTDTNEASSMVIDFCSNDPIVGDTCTAPTGMDASAAALNAAAHSGTVQTGTDNWAVTAGTSQVKIADDNTGGGSGGPHPTHDIQPTSTQSFQLSGITNPSTVGTYYARIYTFNTADYCSTDPPSGAPNCYVNAASPGTYEDYGGIALSTAAIITITARVQEQLTFCISSMEPDNWDTTGPTTGLCDDAVVAANLPAITIGSGTPTAILDPSRIDSTPVYTQLSTNATHGAIVNMRNSNATCTYTGSGIFPGGGLSADGGTTCAIPPINSGLGTGATAMVAGTAAFGLQACAYTPGSNIPPTQSGTLTPTAEYDSGTAACAGASGYGMDTHTNTGGGVGSGGNTVSTYGSTVATTTGPVYAADDEDIFAATPSLTTPAGIYTADLVMIATGTF